MQIKQTLNPKTKCLFCANQLVSLQTTEKRKRNNCLQSLTNCIIIAAVRYYFLSQCRIKEYK